ncbi:MAG: MarR family winged helix-turn-helix transcriptional regulator [Janthinobacterium lividum]
MKLVLFARLYRREIDKALKPFGLTYAVVLPLRYLAQFEQEIGQAQLTEILSIEGPTLVRTLDQLAQSGLLERVMHANDRRANIVRLTPAGHALDQLLRGALHSVRVALFAGVADADLEVMLRGIDTLLENVDRSRDAPAVHA